MVKICPVLLVVSWLGVGLVQAQPRALRADIEIRQVLEVGFIYTHRPESSYRRGLLYGD